MSIADFFDGTCDIYHLVSGTATPGYGLPTSPKHSYPAEPDISGAQCHFHVRTRNITITQTQPANLVEGKEKLSIPVDTDIRINDKVVDCSTGLEYTVDFPRNIRDHHKIANLRRTAQQEPL